MDTDDDGPAEKRATSRTSPDNTGSHAAHLATARKYWRFLGVLVNDCGISVDALCLRDTDGRNVAHLAAANGDSQTLRYLAEKCRLPHSALEQADHWFRTPAHHAALADSAEVLALLQELGAPLHLPMGPLEPQIGAVAIVNQSNEVVRGHIGDRYVLGKVLWVDRHQKMRFEYEKGTKDTEGVEADRCDLAPTPLVLAEKFGRKEASEFLSNAWTPIVAEVSGQIQKDELMLQARMEPSQRASSGDRFLIEQLAVSAVSAMECTCPSFVRAVPAWAVLRSFGRVLRGTNMNAEELYAMSFQVGSIDEFWSHSWHSVVFLKVWLLLMLKNGRAACVGGTLIAALVAYLSYADVLPGWYKEPRLQGPGYSGEFRFSPWANLSGCASALLLLLFWQSPSKVFLDRTCIHQGDGRLKAEGIINLGALLKKSRMLVVVWDPSYLSRLWCVFELAAFLHGHREDPSSLLKKRLVIKPSVLVPLTFLVGANAALTLLFENALPDTDVVAFMRIFLFVASQFPLIYIIQRLWRKVMDAEKQFRNFSLQKEILTDCIVEWYGSVEDFEVSVRTHVHDAFIEQVSRFPLGYQWTVGMTTCILWGQLDAIAARAHGGAYSYAASVVVATMAWFLWVTPTHFLIMIRIIAYLMEACQSKSLLVRSFATCIGYIVIGVFTFLPHALQAVLYQVFPEPLIGRGALPSGVLVSHGAYASVERFLQKGLLDASDKQGWSVVHHAAAAGKAACLEVILELCQLPYSFLVTPDNWGRTPAHVAAEFDAEEVIKVLAKHQAPMHQTMGEPVLQDGVVALVQAREILRWTLGEGFSNTDRPGTGAFGMGHVKSMGGRSDAQTVGARTMGEIDIDLTEDESSYTLGRVNRVFAGDQVVPSGFREGCVELDRCTFCPTPIVLADRRGRTSAVRALLEAAWKPFAEAVASAALAVGCDPEMWEWEDVEEIFREEALQGARPAGALVARRCEVCCCYVEN
eukprot:s2159_g6.t1